MLLLSEEFIKNKNVEKPLLINFYHPNTSNSGLDQLSNRMIQTEVGMLNTKIHTKIPVSFSPSPKTKKKFSVAINIPYNKKLTSF